MNRYFYSKSRGLSRAKLTLTETHTQPHSNIQQKHALLIRYQHVQVLGISCKLIGGNEFVGNQNPAVEFPPTLSWSLGVFDSKGWDVTDKKRQYAFGQQAFSGSPDLLDDVIYKHSLEDLELLLDPWIWALS